MAQGNNFLMCVSVMTSASGQPVHSVWSLPVKVTPPCVRLYSGQQLAPVRSRRNVQSIKPRECEGKLLTSSLSLQLIIVDQACSYLNIREESEYNIYFHCVSLQYMDKVKCFNWVNSCMLLSFAGKKVPYKNWLALFWNICHGVIHYPTIL